jgi:integrase
MKLTDKFVVKLALPAAGEPDRVVRDDAIPGFAIRARPSGAVWTFRYRRGPRRPRLTIGKVSALTATQARAIAAKLYARTQLGEDPAADRADALARAGETVGTYVPQFRARKRAEIRPRSFENTRRHLESHAAPLHRLELKVVDRRTTAALLARVAETSGPVEANSVKSSLAGFFKWALGQGLLDGNLPTAGIPSFPTRGPRTVVPSDGDMVRILRALPATDYGDIVRLLAFTLCRLSEIGNLTWDEIDFTAGLIRLGPERTKTGVARNIPMSAPVRRILEARPRGERAFVFGTGQGGFQGWGKGKIILDQRSGISGWTHHDFRRWGSTTMNAEAIAQPHIIEACLSHAVGDKIARTYNLATYEAQVRTALNAWGQRVERLITGELAPTKVVALRRRKGA